MNNLLGLKSEIPGIWYDIYSRLIPGVLFVGFLQYKKISHGLIPDNASIGFILLAGFFFGLLAQSLSATLAWRSHMYMCGFYYWLHTKRNTIAGEEENVALLKPLYGKRAKGLRQFYYFFDRLGKRMFQAQGTYDKMHAEANAMMQFCILSLAAYIMAINGTTDFNPGLLLIVSILCLISVLNFSYRRAGKIFQLLANPDCLKLRGT